MSYRECTRCKRWFPEEEMFNLGFEDDGPEAVFSCEGCLISMEQDQFYGQASFRDAISAEVMSSSFLS